MPSSEDENDGNSDFSSPKSLPSRSPNNSSNSGSISPPTPKRTVLSDSSESADSDSSQLSPDLNRKQGPGTSKRNVRRKRRKLLGPSQKSNPQQLAHGSQGEGNKSLHSTQPSQGGGNSPQHFASSDSEISSEESGERTSESESQIDSDSQGGSYHSNNAEDASDADSNEDGHQSTESVEYLFNGSEITSTEALLKILKLYIEQRWTKTSLDQTIKLTKELLPQPNGLPSSIKTALKQLELLTTSCAESEFVYCNECLQLTGNCDHNADCGKFYSFSIEDQVKHMFEHRNLASVIETGNKRVREDELICDVTDGLEYKKIKNLLPNEFDLILNWNSDGLALSSSSNQEMWLVLCTICEVPPNLRSSFMLVGGVYVGKKKPDMNVFLKPFADQLQVLWERGVSWVHPTSRESHVSKVAAPALSADAPATAIILNVKNHNARFGCNTCEQKTKKIPLTAEEIDFNTSVTDKRKKKKRKRRFVFQEEPASLRTGPQMEVLGHLAETSGKSRKGVIGSAVVSTIPQFDRAVGVCAEYLHLIMLGVVKYLLLIIFFEQGPWCLKDFIQEIDEFISDGIEVPDFIKRLPRGICDIKFWKASEFRAFLLYYSLPIFKRWLPDVYFQHWLLLVSSTYIFLKECISENDLRAADIMVKSFVRDVGPLYGEACYTYNVHTLLHVPLLVRRWGPLSATSAFVYETFNGFVSHNIHGTKHLGKELIKNIKISQSVAILENVTARALVHTAEAQPHLLGASLPLASLSTKEKECLSSCDFGSYVLHSRLKIKKNCFYSSKLYDNNKKRSDSFVQFKLSDGDTIEYGRIIVFVKSENASLYCLVKVFKVSNINLIYHSESRYVVKHLIPVEDSGNHLVIPVTCLKNKVLKVGMYVALTPNNYEINL